MQRRLMLLAAGAVMFLAGCAPYAASAPVGARNDRICGFVREQVTAGALPLEHAMTFYGHCAPFEAPRD